MATTPPQLLALAVVRVRLQGESRAVCDSDQDCKEPNDEAGVVEFLLPSPEWGSAAVAEDGTAITRIDLLRCVRLLTSDVGYSSSIAGGSNDWGLSAGVEEWQGEDDEEGGLDEEDENEEIFSREMLVVDAGLQDAGVFFTLPSATDSERITAVGLAFIDRRSCSRSIHQIRSVVLLLLPNSELLAVCGSIRASLRCVAARFFLETKREDEFESLRRFYETLEKPKPKLDRHGFLPTAVLVRRLGASDVIAALRVVLLEGRVVCYSASSSVASAAVMALLAMLPPPLAQLVLQERRGKFYVQPCLSSSSTEEQAHSSDSGFLLGTNSALLLKREDMRPDLVLDLDARHVTAHPTTTSERAFAFGTKASALADRLKERFTAPVAPMRITGQQGRDAQWVIAQCHTFFEDLKKAEVLACLSEKEKPGEDPDAMPPHSIGDLMPASLRSMLEELTAPVLESLGHRSDDEHALAPRPAFCADYGWSWTTAWKDTSNYAHWIALELDQKRHTSGDTLHPPLKPPPMEGRATYTYMNGDEYEGEFVRGKREGLGVYVERGTGNQYDGMWLADKRHGRGVLTSKASGGYIYDGEWVNDMRCGQGHSARRGGENYTGEWRANRFHGRGIYVSADGDVYDGEWRDGVRYGAGKFMVAKPTKVTTGTLGGVVQYVGEWAGGKFHGVGSCKYTDGSEYSGTFQDGRRHGTGVLLLASGDRYDGQWWQGLRHGQGTAFSAASGITREGAWKRGMEVSDGEWLLTFANGDKYSGACRRGRPWGKGTCKFANGTAYTGDWVDGLREGFGVCAQPDGTILEGQWKHSVLVQSIRSPSTLVDISLSSGSPSKPPEVVEKEEDRRHPVDGLHRHVYPNGDVYEGEFKHGLLDGFGVFTERATGNTYEGSWVQGQRDGTGVLTSGAKDFIYDGAWERDERCGYGHCVISGGRETYSGQWLANAFHGTGKYTDAEGNIYEGEFVRGKRHGVGKLLVPLAASNLEQDIGGLLQIQQYSGEWCEGHREGLGDAVFTDGSRYSGQWKADLQDGEGTFTSAHGEQYVGQWHLGRREGSGVLTVTSSGATKEGQWHGDEPLDGEWTIMFPDGSKFTGECVGGRPHGHGVCKYANGDLYDGMWVEGKRHGMGSGFFANGERFVGQWENNHVALSGQGKLTLADGTEHEYTG